MTETAGALVPLLSAGAGGAVQQAAEDAGAGAYHAVARVLAKIRARFGDEPEPAADAVADVLREALADGSLEEEDLRAVASLHIEIGDGAVHVGSMRIEGNAYTGNTFNIGGDFKG